MKKVLSVQISVFVLLFLMVTALQASVVTYIPDNTTIFKNPERGFTEEVSHKVSVSSPHVVKGEIGSSWGKKDNMTLAMVLYNFGNFKAADLPDEILDAFDEDMQVLRDNGLKCVLRFAYTESQSDKVDATPEWVKRHLEQLKPHLKANADVIYVLEAGFIGSWGEWYYTTHYTNESQKMNSKRRKVIDYLFENVPEDRFILFRYPLIKIGYLGDEVPLSETEAFAGTQRARMGCHNDAFLNSYGNDGTYGRDDDGPEDDPVLREYIAAETMYVPNGGETNVEKSSLAEKVYKNGPAEMSTYHWSFCGSSYAQQVTGRWRESGLFDTINVHMGYRYNLVDGQFSDQAAPGGKMNMTIRICNTGYAPLYNARKAYLVLQGAQNTEYRIPLSSDPRRWKPNYAISAINEQVSIPAEVKEGTYHLYLYLPDQYASLASDARYAVRMANKDVWDPDKGWNDLGAEVTISQSAPADPGELPEVELSPGRESIEDERSEASGVRKIIENGILYIVLSDGKKYSVL